VLDLRGGEKYIANSPVALPRRRQTASGSCISSTSRFSSFDLIRLSEREAADRHTRKFSRTGIHGGPSDNCGVASFFFAGTATYDYRPRAVRGAVDGRGLTPETRLVILN
jgi:hypothetical protein